MRGATGEFSLREFNLEHLICQCMRDQDSNESEHCEKEIESGAFAPKIPHTTKRTEIHYMLGFIGRLYFFRFRVFSSGAPRVALEFRLRRNIAVTTLYVTLELPRFYICGEIV